MENQNQQVESYSYADTVKGAILGALKNGTSVLQEDRSGIGYVSNLDSHAIYSGVVQLFLKQEQKNKGFNSPFVMTSLQMRKKGFLPIPGEKSSPISYYSSALRYHKTEYVLVNGVPDKSQILHSKNQIMLDDKGQPKKGFEYNNAFFTNQIDPDREIGRDGKAVARKFPSPIKIDTEIHLNSPFPDAKPGVYYKAKDNSVIERFGEVCSKYVNSLFTDGFKYTAAKFSKKDIAELETHIGDKNSPFFRVVNDAFFVATGQDKKLENIEKKREENKVRKSGGIKAA